MGSTPATGFRNRQHRTVIPWNFLPDRQIALAAAEIGTKNVHQPLQGDSVRFSPFVRGFDALGFLGCFIFRQPGKLVLLNQPTSGFIVESPPEFLSSQRGIDVELFRKDT